MLIDLKRRSIIAIRTLLSSENPSSETKEEARDLLKDLMVSMESHQVTSVNKDDLYNLGFLPDTVDADTMDRLAEKLANDYCEQLFHTSLDIIAHEYFKIPKWSDIIEPLVDFCDNILDTTFDADERTLVGNSKSILLSIDMSVIDNFSDISNEHRDSIFSTLSYLKNLLVSKIDAGTPTGVGSSMPTHLQSFENLLNYRKNA